MTTIITIFGLAVIFFIFAAKTRNKTFHITQIGEEFFIVTTWRWLNFTTSYAFSGVGGTDEHGFLDFREAQRALKRLKKGKKI